MTPVVRFLRAELGYGCHATGVFEIPAGEVPVVIAGPNGSGKTTLVEALVRTLFGFDRRQPDDRECLASRDPWGGRGCRAEVELLGADGRRWRVRREFDDGHVRIESEDGVVWSGDGNPAASNQESIEYRRRLAAIFGIGDLEHYLSTACVVQGQLLDTELREELLQIEAGGFGTVQDALERIEKAHDALTARPLDAAGRGKTKPRRLELVDEALERLRSRLAAAEGILAWRAPLEQELDAARARLAELDAEIARLEAALSPLSGRRALEARIDALISRQTTLRTARHRVDRTSRQLAEIEDAVSVPIEERYPPDFLERLGRVEWMWDRQSTLRAERDRLESLPRLADVPGRWIAPALAASLAAIGFAISVVIDSVVPGAVGLVLAVVGGVALLAHRQSRLVRREDALRRKQIVYGELESLAQELVREMEGIPRAGTLSAATVQERRRAFDTQRQAAERLGAAREQLEQELLDASRALAATPPTEGTLQDLAALRAEECRAAVRQIDAEIRDARAEIERLATIPLPPGVDAAPEAVEAALASCRRERASAAELARTTETRLLQEGTGDENPVAIRDEIEALEGERAEIEREARVHEAAHALVRDAYREFREHDRERLLNAVSRALGEVSGGRLGPVEAPGPLAEATVRLEGRAVPLRSPPLSYGEFHAALLGIRLGASDFHARAGIRPPLVVDEPFAYLDADRARELWRLLCGAARERQVFVLTQETWTLAALGVAPDIELPPADRRSALSAGTSPSSRAP